MRVLSGKTGTPLWQYSTNAFGGGGWVYLRGDRQDEAGFGVLDLA